MPQIITTFPAIPDSTQTVTLGGERFRLRIFWRERLAGWYLDIFDASGEPLATCIRVSPGCDLLNGLLRGVPAGHLVVTGPDPYTRDMLGSEVLIIFFKADEAPDAPASTLRVDV